jgi:multisubunit Na+/H+ antiporter MnhB subunit
MTNRPELARCGLRALVFIGWIVGSLIAWDCVLYFVGEYVLGYFVNDRQVHLPDWFFPVLNYAVFFGGSVLIPAMVALLALRGNLPGTRRVSGAASQPPAAVGRR